MIVQLHMHVHYQLMRFKKLAMVTQEPQCPSRLLHTRSSNDI
jgi:hypothetical protein